MKQDIIKTDKYLLIVSDEEIKEDDFFYDLDTNYLKIKQSWENSHLDFNSKKIIAHLPLNNSPILEGVDLLPPLEDEVEKLANEYTSNEKHSGWWAFLRGYNKAREKYKYTEEDIKTLIGKIRSALPKHNYNHYSIDFDEFIQSLQQPKYPIGFECEMENKIAIDGHTVIGSEPKTTTNSQGQTVLEGKYIYD